MTQVLGQWSRTAVRLSVIERHYPLKSRTEQVEIARWAFVECLKHYATRDDYVERKQFAAYLERQGYNQREANTLAEMLSI